LESKNAKSFIESLKNEKQFIQSLIYFKHFFILYFLDIIHEFPDVLIEQLLKNSSNQIRFTVMHEKNKEINSNPNFNSLDFLKIYVKILENYRYIDSDMMSTESSKLLEKSGVQDLDETVKLKKDFAIEKKPHTQTQIRRGDTKKESKVKRESSAKVPIKKIQKWISFKSNKKLTYKTIGNFIENIKLELYRK